MLGDHFITEWFIKCVISILLVSITVMYNFLAEQKNQTNKQQFLHELQSVDKLSRLLHLQRLIHATHHPCPSNSSAGSQFTLNLCSWLSKLPLTVLPQKPHRSRNILILLYIPVFHSPPYSSLSALGCAPEDATCPASWLCSTLPQDIHRMHLSVHAFAVLPNIWPKAIMQQLFCFHTEISTSWWDFPAFARHLGIFTSPAPLLRGAWLFFPPSIHPCVDIIIPPLHALEHWVKQWHELSMNDRKSMVSSDVLQFVFVSLLRSLPAQRRSNSDRAILWLRLIWKDCNEIHLSGLSKCIAPAIRFIKEGEIPRGESSIHDNGGGCRRHWRQSYWAGDAREVLPVPLSGRRIAMNNYVRYEICQWISSPKESWAAHESRDRVSVRKEISLCWQDVQWQNQTMACNVIG